LRACGGRVPFSRGRNKNKSKKKTKIDDLLKKVEARLEKGDVKATVADYIRLVQLQKEMEEDEPTEIRVTWVEPETKKSDSGE
jgi:hypothetical protein